MCGCGRSNITAPVPRVSPAPLPSIPQSLPRQNYHYPPKNDSHAQKLIQSLQTQATQPQPTLPTGTGRRRPHGY